MPNIMQKWREFLGLSSKTKTEVNGGVTTFSSSHPLIKGNKNIEKGNTIKTGEAKRMFEFDESLRKAYQEIAESELYGERRPGEFLVEFHPAEGDKQATYKAVRLDITAIFEMNDEYSYTKYYKMASHSESFVTDLSTINLGSNATDAAAEARIKRILAEPKYARTKLDYINLIEVDSTGIPLGMNIEKVPAMYFLVNYKKLI